MYYKQDTCEYRKRNEKHQEHNQKYYRKVFFTASLTDDVCVCSCNVVNLNWKLSSTVMTKVLAYMYIVIFISKRFLFYVQRKWYFGPNTYTQTY